MPSGGFFTEETNHFWHLDHNCIHSLSWCKNAQHSQGHLISVPISCWLIAKDSLGTKFWMWCFSTYPCFNLSIYTIHAHEGAILRRCSLSIPWVQRILVWLWWDQDLGLFFFLPLQKSWNTASLTDRQYSYCSKYEGFNVCDQKVSLIVIIYPSIKGYMFSSSISKSSSFYPTQKFKPKLCIPEWRDKKLSGTVILWTFEHFLTKRLWHEQ